MFKARSHLAAIDFQKHKDRPVKLKKDGTPRYLLLMFTSIFREC